nr:MAG TPA: hypothetical protein [Bacteriophage sp.]
MKHYSHLLCSLPLTEHSYILRYVVHKFEYTHIHNGMKLL